MKGRAKDDAPGETIRWIAVSIQIILTFPANGWQEEQICLYPRHGWRRVQHSEKVLTIVCLCAGLGREYSSAMSNWDGREQRVKLCFFERSRYVTKMILGGYKLHIQTT